MLKTVPYKKNTEKDVLFLYDNFYSKECKNIPKEDVLNHLREELSIVELREGVIQENSLNFNHKIELKSANYGENPEEGKFSEYPNSIEDSYGVCDNFQQVIDRYDLENLEETYCISITPIVKTEQPSNGGWRWHKWGRYIGNQTPTTEYLYDEPEIEQVFVFHIYEFKN